MGHVLVEKEGGGPNSTVEEGQPNGFALGLEGPTQFSDFDITLLLFASNMHLQNLRLNMIISTIQLNRNCWRGRGSLVNGLHG